MRYSTFQNIIDVQATVVEESWETFTERLSKFVVTDDKRAGGLFCGATFMGSGRRGKNTSDESSMVILDFDNTCRDKDGNKLCIANPVQAETIEATLLAAGLAFVLVTSHSHRDEWPHFRVVLPLETPVKASKWLEFTAGLLRQLHLDDFKDAIDPCYKTISQIYYWPAHGEGKPHRFIQWPGRTFVPTLTMLPRKSRESAHRELGAASMFTEEQVLRYFSTVEPDLDWSGPEENIKNTCPFHKGNRVNFYVNRSNGLWQCHSTECDPSTEDGKRSGNIYGFHVQKFGGTYHDARKAVHDIMGGEPGAGMTTEELQEVIAIAQEEAVPYLIEEIAKQSTSVRPQLQKQLAETFPALTKDEIKKQVASKRKVVALRPERVEAESDTPIEYAENAYGLRLDPDRYVMDASGVYTMKQTREGDYVKAFPPITDRPIWIETFGTDYATDRTWIKLAWEGSQVEVSDRKRHTEWLPAESLSSKETLFGLDDGPVSPDNFLGVTGFLRYAKTVLTTPHIPVTSKIGWVEKDGEYERFVLPSDEEFSYIGPPMTIKGEVASWARGLQVLLATGEQGFTGLTLAGLSAAAPFVRLLGKRRPMAGIIAESSTGKGMVINFAVSIWCNPKLLSIPVGSTFKGIQDKNVTCPDYPMVFDELQQIGKDNPTALENLMYFAGNAQRRFTSQRSQQAKGGDYLYGVCMFASEHDIIPVLERGAQNRVIGLYGKPLPNEMSATLLQKCASRNWGVIGHEIGKIVNERVAVEMQIIEEYAADIAANSRKLKGDDHFAIALIRRGLELLEEITSVALPIAKHLAWLIQLMSSHREITTDSVQDVFSFVMDTVISSEWGNGGPENILFEAGNSIAWRLTEVIDPMGSPLEVNFSSKRVNDLLKSRSQTEKIVREWISRGWVRAQSKNAYWIRPMSKTSGAGAKVWRVTVEGLKVLGYGPNFEPLTEG